MATLIRRTEPAIARVADSHNSLMQYVGAGALYHVDQSEVIPAQADASTDALAYALVNECLAVYQGDGTALGAWIGHVNDTLAHKVVDAVGVSGVTTHATTLVTAYALANALQTAMVAHCTSTGVHYNNDTVNGVTLNNIPAATSSGTLHTLANGLKAFLLAHLASGPSEASMIRAVDA
jgi:hypothetical protein